VKPRRGQALVEMALVLPLLLFLFLGAVEAAFLLTAKAYQDRATSVVAVWAAEHPRDSSWNSIAVRELPGCTVTVTTPRPDLIEATAICLYHPVATHGLWNGLPMTSRESANVSPSPKPGASVSPSPTKSPGKP
jgi:hypothetical protein